jgi:predicted PurR-regulated permease PerM
VLGVLGGVFAFGALGIFLGPVLLAVGWMLVLEFARPDPHPKSLQGAVFPPSPFIS